MAEQIKSANLNGTVAPQGIKTKFTDSFSIKYPIIGAPMFLVSNVEMVVEISEAGALGTLPSLNFRPVEAFQSALKEIKKRTNKPIGVNIIVNKSNLRAPDDLKACLNEGVDLFITSLGNPAEVIREAHKIGSKVYCDVVSLEHAKKVRDLGADGIIAVGSGAGGHAGPISPLVLVPWLAHEIELPVMLAGGVASGEQITAALALGAAGVHVGTRFIASRESPVDASYKAAVLRSTPEDIVMTSRISGTPAAVIKTPFIEKQGTELPILLKLLYNNSATRKYAGLLIHVMGMKSLENAAQKTTWKEVWSAGQSVGLIHDEKSCREIVFEMMEQCHKSLSNLSTLAAK